MGIGWIIFSIIMAILCLILLLPVSVKLHLRGKQWQIAVYYGPIAVFRKSSQPNSADSEPSAEVDGESKEEHLPDTVMDAETMLYGDEETSELPAAPPKKQTKQQKPANQKVHTQSVTQQKSETADRSEPQAVEPNRLDEESEQQKEASESEKDSEAENKPAKKGFLQRLKPSNLSEALSLLEDILASASPSLRFLFRHFYIRHLNLSITIGTQDAAKTAILYGAVSGAVFRLVGYLQSLLSVKADALRVRADFLSGYSTAECSLTLRVAPATVFGTGIGLASRFLFRTLRRFHRENREQKRMEKESAPLPLS
ncbi:MAG: DUF2953 domain-containing protein [Oscillospiraceae bacterium]|nr:DUF2953 domain-containing protein [Oscillospiraceae bacterium]